MLAFAVLAFGPKPGHVRARRAVHRCGASNRLPLSATNRWSKAAAHDARYFHQPFEPRSEGSPTTSRRRWTGSASSRCFSISTRRPGIGAGRELGKAALRGVVALSCGDPGADAELARLHLVPDRARAGARARQGDPADHLRAARRALRPAGDPIGRPARLEGGRPRAHRAAAARDHQRARPRLHARPEPAALSRHPCLRGRGRRDLFRPRRREPRGDRAARCAPHPGRRPLSGDHRRVRLRQVVAAQGRRAAAACSAPARMAGVADHSAREGADGGARQGDRRSTAASRTTGALAPAARQRRSRSTMSRSCSRTCALATRATATVLLPIDQFEEVFTVATPARAGCLPASARVAHSIRRATCR